MAIEVKEITVNGEKILINSNGIVTLQPKQGRKTLHTEGVTDERGYKRLNIGYKYFYIHRLMAEAFLNYDYDSELEINHIDHNKSNNKLENLELVTHKENMKKASSFGVMTGNKSKNRLFKGFIKSEQEALELLEKYKTSKAKDLAIEYNVSLSTMKDALKRYKEKYGNQD